MKELYRYDAQLWASLDEWGEAVGRARQTIELRTYPVTRRTSKGVWIDVYGRERFVLLSARKRFACPTVEEAKESFIARKRSHIKKLRRQLEYAEEALAVAENALQVVA